MSVRIVADLQFTVTAERDQPPVTGRVRADGAVVTVDVSRAPSLLGSGDRRRSRWVAETLDRQGLTVQLRAPSGWVLAVGHQVTAPWWQRPFTGSRRIRLGPVRSLVSTARGPRIFAVAG